MNSSATDAAAPFLGQLGSADFPAARDRYHLYVGLFCPFAHRVLIARHLKGLVPFLPLSVVKPYPKDGGGWRFPASDSEYAGATVDHLFGSAFLHKVYFRARKDYAGKYSVPALWDMQRATLVNNESHDLLRALSSAFNELLPEGSRERSTNLYPPALRARIDAVAAWMAPELNIGVYKAGFAETQDEYEAAAHVVFRALDRAEGMLGMVVDAGQGAFLLGAALTEADVKLYTTLVRFDVVYVQHFKLNVGTVRHNFPRLHFWLKHLYWKVPGFRETTDFRHIKESYTKSHPFINPRAITPIGPVPDVEEWTEADDEMLKRATAGL